MAIVKLSKTSFAAGEVSPKLLGRGDLRAFENGAKRLRNVFIAPAGSVSRRDGLRYVATAAGTGRLVAFEFNTEQTYLLVFTDQNIAVYKDDVWKADIPTDWEETHLKDIAWTQSADTLLVVHPGLPPKKITRTSDIDWTIDDWSFYDEQDDDKNYDRIQQPFHKFADDDVEVTPSGTGKGSSITVTASADAFQSEHVGMRLRIGNKELEVTAFTSATEVTATVKEALGGTAATKDWEEPAFSTLRGWPATVCFHQDRLVIGGARDLPNRLWMSKSSDLFNFDLGEGLDDEGIEFAILSDQVNAIRAVFSGRHLQVFTSGAEWMVTGDPLTPENLQLKRQTRIGSRIDRMVPPRDVDGATLFVPRNGKSVYEFMFTDIEQAYQNRDMAMLARHLISDTVDHDYDSENRLLFLVQSDGSLATLTMYRSEEVNAWAGHATDGSFLSMVMVDETAYVMVDRAGTPLIERFDPELSLDSALTGSDAAGKATWSGLDHLEGRTVKVVANGALQADTVVQGGAISLSEPAQNIQVGLPFTHEVEPLPPAMTGIQNGGQGGRIRLVAATFRLYETASLRLDVGRGLVEVPFRRFGSSAFDSPPATFTGDKTVRAFGWKDADTESLWRIESDVPLPFTLLSVTTEISANG